MLRIFTHLSSVVAFVMVRVTLGTEPSIGKLCTRQEYTLTGTWHCAHTWPQFTLAYPSTCLFLEGWRNLEENMHRNCALGFYSNIRLLISHSKILSSVYYMGALPGGGPWMPSHFSFLNISQCFYFLLSKNWWHHRLKISSALWLSLAVIEE